MPEITITPAFLQDIFPNGRFVVLKKHDAVCRIHEKVNVIHWLISGTIGFFMPLRDGDDEMEVCQVSESFLPIGWNGLNLPGRHTKNIIVASDEAVFYCVTLDENRAFLKTLPNSTLQLHVCRKQFGLLKAAVFRQKDALPAEEVPSQRIPDRYFESSHQDRDTIIELLKRSPFLEPFDNTDLHVLASIATRRDYDAETSILYQDKRSDGLYILIDGDVSIERIENGHILTQWPITDTGSIFGWPTFIGESEYCAAIANQTTSAYFIAEKTLMALFAENADLALRFFTRMNWLVDNHVSAAFIRYLSFLYNFNQLSIRHLIECYQTQLDISSPLHRIPHLLNDRSTKHLAFDILENLKTDGSARERRISSISLDVLKGERREMEFLDQLAVIYRTVAYQAGVRNPQETRTACAIEVKKLCELMDYELEGMENLPDTSGHIFIYNHLLNPPYYTLNNNFQITLDSHFISAMVLNVQYGEPGIRTVRIGSSQEFAHQDYYEKLGYINVLTKDSGNATDEQRTATRNGFFEAAKSILADGFNLIISPEGTSYRTEDDIPGTFKSGAFSLALQAKNEPYIVPIVLLNFDKRIQEGKKYCRILKPFRVSEHPLFRGINQLQAFVREYREAFKKELDETKATYGIS